MKFSIDKKIFDSFPGFTLGLIVANGLDNRLDSLQIANLLEQKKLEILSSLNPESLIVHPKIQCWRNAYSKFGAKPKEHKSSVENLCQFLLSGNSIRLISPIVDIYNYICLKYLLPAGAEDLDKIKGDVLLTFATASEPPLILLGEKEARAPKIGEVIYKDDFSAICRRWNWKEADRTKITRETKNCILVIEGLPPGSSDVGAATTELSQMVSSICGGSCRSVILDSKDNVYDLLN